MSSRAAFIFARRKQPHDRKWGGVRRIKFPCSRLSRCPTRRSISSADLHAAGRSTRSLSAGQRSCQSNCASICRGYRVAWNVGAEFSSPRLFKVSEESFLHARDFLQKAAAEAAPPPPPQQVTDLDPRCFARSERCRF